MSSTSTTSEPINSLPSTKEGNLTLSIETSSVPSPSSAANAPSLAMATTIPHNCQTPIKMTMVSDLSDCPIYEIKLNPAPKWTRYPSKIEAARLKAKEAVHVEKVWLQRDNKVEPGSSFIYFSKLPPELRLMIWDLCHPGPRLVEIRRKKLYEATTARNRGKETPMSLYSPTTIPALLHTNLEARTLALTWYKLSFADRKEENYKKKKDKGPKIFFDSSVDIFYMWSKFGHEVNSTELKSALTANDRAKIRHVAVDANRKTFSLTFFPKLEVFEVVRERIRRTPHVSTNLLNMDELAVRFTLRKARELKQEKERSRTPRVAKCKLLFTEYRTVEEGFETSEDQSRPYCSECVHKRDYIYSTS